jgi:hypothetical protein
MSLVPESLAGGGCAFVFVWAMSSPAAMESIRQQHYMPGKSQRQQQVQM